MKLRKLSAIAALVLPLACPFSAIASDDASPTPKPTLLNESLQFLHIKHAPKAANGPSTELHHGLQVQLDITPLPFSLSKDREVQATVTLFNRTRKYVDLNFPTSQRIEIVVIDPGGKVVNTWSEDQSFTSDPASITVNPQERLQYTANVATREMSAGQPYTIEASFPSYPDLKVDQKVIPQK
jgi:hypothetical protein